MRIPPSALNRPLDPHYPTNRAVLIILPIAALLAAGLAFAAGREGWPLLGAALSGAGAAFGGWALARELAPDDNSAAFVSMAVAYSTNLLVDHTSVMLLILAIMLARIVNHSVGIATRVTDSLAIVGLVAWTMYSNRNPLPAVVAAFAFALDATLKPRSRRQWIFALLCLLLASLVVLPQVPWNGVAPIETPWLLWVLAAIAVGFVVTIVRTERLVSLCDATGAPLLAARVRAAMTVTLMSATSGLIPLSHGLAQTAMIWGVLASVMFGGVWRSLRAHSVRAFIL